MSKRFIIDIEPEAFNDIQKAIDFYNSKKQGLGKQFFDEIDLHFSLLEENYYSFQIRYDEFRCLPVKKFPYMIHYKVIEKQGLVSIKAVFCTYEDPEKWMKRVND